jgi:hypothetical protein
MLSITIDASTFAPPFSNPTSDGVYLFVEQILEWKGALNAGAARILTSRRAPEVLIRCGLYPLRPLLTALLRQTAVIEYDANTIAVLVETLLNGSLKLEDQFLVADVLTSDLSFTPDIFESYDPAALREECQRCAVVIAILRKHGRDPVLPNHAIAVRARRVDRTVHVRALLEIVDHTRDDLSGLALPPEYFEGSILLCDSFEDYLLGIEEMVVWQNATGDDGLDLAIRIALFKERHRRGAGADWDDLPRFAIGGQFFASVASAGAFGASGFSRRTLRAVVETIEHINLPDTHHLRTGAGGGNPQRMRGADGAWRRDIDYEYHLHYWECCGGFVELASVVTHNDFTIPE